MIIHYYDNAQLSKQFGIDISNIEVPNLSAGWGRVPPLTCSSSHQHDEVEMFIIISGYGKLIVDGRSYAVKAGTVIVFEPFESHVLENNSDEDIVFFLYYYRDLNHAKISASSSERQNPKRPQFVFSTPPTPNGDLHLGHLSGPYLGADVYVRYQRLIGNSAWHLTGSDDYQSYVLALANAENSTSDEIAEYYSQEIFQTLKLMDIDIDQYTVTNCVAGYQAGTQDFFTHLLESGKVTFCDIPAFRDAISDEYLYEAYISGGCPSCGSKTNGNICEECGEPNLVVDMISPISKINNIKPKLDSVSQYILPLHEFSQVVTKHHQVGRVPARMRELASRVFARFEVNLPISHLTNWGVPPKEQEGVGQVIWVWPEMSYSFLYGIEMLGKKLNQSWRADDPDHNWKIIHFFGYDNSFYHTILYPILYHLAYPSWQPDIDYHYNEFYLLDGKKFSTSRRHAIWGKEILTSESVDSVRYYLSLTRPEQTRTNFQLEAYKTELNETLIGVWQTWLHDLGQRITDVFKGIAPDAGIWTKEHVAYWAQLNNHLSCMTGALNPDGFSLRRAARQLNMLVQETVEFSYSQQRLLGIEIWKDEYRTTIALELAAVQLLAIMANPLMPRFSSRLFEALGNENQIICWPKHVELILPGQIISLNKTIFFTRPDTQLEEVPEEQWLIKTLRRLRPQIEIRFDSTLTDLGITSLIGITLQYQLLNEKKIDISLEHLLNQSINDIAKQMVKNQTSNIHGTNEVLA